MPPVMGAAAFLIAEFLSLPYGQVALAALLPALLYYLALFTQIDLEAARHGLGGLPRAEIPRLGAVMRRGWVFVVPLGLLVYGLMIALWDAGRAGIAAALATLLVGALTRETRPTPAAILRGVVDTGRVLLDLVAVSALAGLVIGALQLSGFTSKLPILLTTLAGGDALGLLALTALVCVVLGMSLPTVVVYVTLAVLVAPALAQLGIEPLAAHLFLFYFGMLSLITPPNCLATFTAAAIAGADFWRTGWTGMRLGIVAYVVPFVFVYHPALVFRGAPAEIVLALATAAAGVALLSVGCVGWLFGPLGPGRRVLFIAAGALLLPAPASTGWLALNVAGVGAGVVLVARERLQARTGAAAAGAPARESIP
jgi:TRAP transporter 4TM/12TM fusion protein